MGVQFIHRKHEFSQVKKGGLKVRREERLQRLLPWSRAEVHKRKAMGMGRSL